MFEIKLEFTRRFPVHTQFCMLAGFFFFFLLKEKLSFNTHGKGDSPSQNIQGILTFKIRLKDS